MWDYSESPPPLHHSPATSDQSRFASRDSTPVTPVDCDSAVAKKQEKERDSRLPWFKKPIDVGKPTTSLSLDSALLEPDFDDASFPLFDAPPSSRSMAGKGSAAPIDIASRQASTSPRGPQPSNLTSALRKSPDGGSGTPKPRNMDAVTNGSRYNTNNKSANRLENGAVPIFPGDKPRRESIAQSLGTGMSWGGVSVGSWIRDE